MSFDTKTFVGQDGTKFELTSFSSTVEGERKECAKLSRSGFQKTPAAMRLEMDDLGVLATIAYEAFMQAMGRKVMEVTPFELEEGDAIDGIGAIEFVQTSAVPDSMTLTVQAVIAGSGTKIEFTSNADGKFNQLVDITRSIP